MISQGGAAMVNGKISRGDKLIAIDRWAGCTLDVLCFTIIGSVVGFVHRLSEIALLDSHYTSTTSSAMPCLLLGSVKVGGMKLQDVSALFAGPVGTSTTVTVRKADGDMLSTSLRRCSLCCAVSPCQYVIFEPHPPANSIPRHLVFLMLHQLKP